MSVTLEMKKMNVEGTMCQIVLVARSVTEKMRSNLNWLNNYSNSCDGIPYRYFEKLRCSIGTAMKTCPRCSDNHGTD